MNKEFKAYVMQMQTGTDCGHYDSMTLCSADEVYIQDGAPARFGKRKAAFVLVSTDHGTMIVNRFDYKMITEDNGFGVGFALLTNSMSEIGEIDTIKQLLTLRQKFFGDGVRVLDVGANIGVHAVSWAKHMSSWGTLLSFEPQEPLYYALCGNIVINNCTNAKALWAACGDRDGTIDIPQPDYTQPGTFGSLELRKTEDNEDIGQKLDYEKNLVTVPILRIDSLKEQRVDLLKIDVENMEPEVLAGAVETINRCHPIIMAEVFKSAHQQTMEFFMAHDYHWFPFGWSLLAIHKNDPVIGHVKWESYTNAE
jgi:FkbM family methyltransferase